MNIIPGFIRCRIVHRPNLIKIIDNIGWLFFDKILRLGVGLLVGIWVARYLGPEQFGVFNYAFALVSLFGAIGGLGLNGIVVRDLVNHPEDAGSTLGTAFFLQVIGGLLVFTLAVVTVSMTRPGDEYITHLVVIMSFATIFKATEVVKYWFESQLQSKYTVWVENISFVMLALVKVILVLKKASLMAFAWAGFIETVLVSTGLMATYAWKNGVFGWRLSLERARTLLNHSWPLILSGLAIMAYMRIDQIMLGQLLGDEAVGIYSAAIRVSEVWYFIPTAIVTSVFPSIIQAKKYSKHLYNERLQNLYNLMFFLSFIIALSVTFLSNWIAYYLFGDSFHGVASVLAIHVWVGVFCSFSIASGKWFINEGFIKLAFLRNLYGLFLNIPLNYALIPIYQAEGAAIATLVSYSVSAYFSDVFSHKTRGMFFQKTKSIFVGWYLIYVFIKKNYDRK